MEQQYSGQPSALRYLFFGTIWERFAFYIVQGLFVIFFTQEYQFSDEKTYTLFGVFTALAFMAPLLGGYIADKLIGLKVAIFFGAAYLAAGYYLLAMPWEHSDFLALGALIIGNGLYKPNVSALLGAMYKPSESKLLERGFVIYYVAVNIGIVLAGLVSGKFQEHFGWHPTFLLSTLSLLMGLITFVLCIKLTKIDYRVTEKLRSPRWFLTLPFIILYTAMAVPILGFFLEVDVPAEWVLTILGAALILFFFSLVRKQLPGERKKLFVLSTLFLTTIIFWSLSLQPFFSLTLFIQDLVNHNIAGFRVHTTFFYAILALFVILLSPLFARLWVFYKYSRRISVIILGFIFCMCCLAIGFFVIAWGSAVPDYFQPVNMLWIIAAYFFFALSEIMFSAIGLSAIKLLASDKLLHPSVIMWFIATGFGGVYAGWVAKRTDIPQGMQDYLGMLTVYHHSFMDFAWFSLIMAAILVVVYAITRSLTTISG